MTENSDTPVAWLYEGPDGQHYINEHRDIAYQQLVGWGWTETPLRRPTSAGQSEEDMVNQVARALYECERERSDHVDKILSATTGKPVKFQMEHWDDVADLYRSDARAALSALALSAVQREARREDNRSACERLVDILRGSSLKPTKRYLSAALLGYDYARSYARWEGYLEGVEAGAKAADSYEGTASNERCDDPQAAAACDIAAAIRALKEGTDK